MERTQTYLYPFRSAIDKEGDKPWHHLLSHLFINENLRRMPRKLGRVVGRVGEKEGTAMGPHRPASRRSGTGRASSIRAGPR